MLAVVTLAACGGGSDASSTKDGLPKEITIASINEITGRLAPYGEATVNGQRIALAEINASGFLGDSKLKLNVLDTTSEPAQGAALVTKAAGTDSPVILGSISSPASAEAPVAQRLKVPFLQFSGTTELSELGKYVWSAGPPQKVYTHWNFEFLKDKGASRVAVLYDSDNTTQANIATVTVPALAKENGIEIVANQAITTQTTDASGAVQKLLAAKPDAINIICAGGHQAAIVSQIRAGGFDGYIVGSAGMDADILKPVSKDAQGIIWATNFSSLSDEPAAKKLGSAYEKKYGKTPAPFSAFGYDAMWMTARALKESGSLDREEFLKAFTKLADGGFTDLSQGKLTFKDRVAQVPGLLIEYKGTELTPVAGFGTD